MPERGRAGRPAMEASTAIGACSTQGQKALTKAARHCPRLVNAFMSKSDEARLREQRLAQKLRENLKRRKAQVRARAQSDARAPGEPEKPAGDQKD